MKRLAALILALSTAVIVQAQTFRIENLWPPKKGGGSVLTAGLRFKSTVTFGTYLGYSAVRYEIPNVSTGKTTTGLEFRTPHALVVYDGLRVSVHPVDTPGQWDSRSVRNVFLGKVSPVTSGVHREPSGRKRSVEVRRSGAFESIQAFSVFGSHKEPFLSAKVGQDRKVGTVVLSNSGNQMSFRKVADVPTVFPAVTIPRDTEVLDYRWGMPPASYRWDAYVPQSQPRPTVPRWFIVTEASLLSVAMVIFVLFLWRRSKRQP